MNAAAKAINQSNLFSGQLLQMRLSKPFCLLLALLGGVLVTALAVIYTTNEHRSEFSQLQQLAQQAQHLQLQHAQLLLEQASLATPARVEEVAANKLDMHLPLNKQQFILQIQ